MKLRFKQIKTKAYQQGSALIEGLIAILVLSIGILAMLQYQVTTLRDNNQAAKRVNAVMYANELLAVAEAETSLANLSCYNWSEATSSTCSEVKIKNFVNNWAERVKTSLPGANQSGHMPIASYDTATKRLTITIKWQVPSEDEHKYVSVTDFSSLN